LGIVSLIIAIGAFLNFTDLADQHANSIPRDITCLAPIQQPGSALTLDFSNLSTKFSVAEFLGYAWPALLAILVWGYGWITERQWFKSIGWLIGWMVLVWASLRSPNGIPIFAGVLLLFLLVHSIIPVFVRLWQIPNRAASQSEAGAGTAPAVIGLFLLGLIWLTSGCAGIGTGNTTSRVSNTNESSLPESVFQDIRIEDKFALATAKIHWRAEKGKTLPLLFEPAVLTSLNYPSNSLKLVRASARVATIPTVSCRAGKELSTSRRVIKSRSPKRERESGFTLPVPFGLVNRLKLAVVNNDVDVFSPQAVFCRARDLGQQHRRHRRPLARFRCMARLETSNAHCQKRKAGLLL